MNRPVLEEGADPRSGSEQQSQPQASSWDQPGSRWLAWTLVAVSVLVFAAWAYLAIAHVDDRYQLDHVSGARMALAQYFNHGTLYPELYDGRFYGGTRFMPLPIVLHGLLARLTGEYLISGKLLGEAAMLGLLATVVVLLRRLRCPLPLALILAAVLLTTKTGLAATMDVRADVIPLLLQLLAVWIVASTERLAPTAGAAALATLAFVSKLSAVWAPLAIVIWLVFHDRKRLGVFSATYVALTGGLLILFADISGGRILENVFGLSTSGITGIRSLLEAPYRLMHLMVEEATTGWALVPLVGLAVWLSVKGRHGSIYLVSLLAALAVLLVVLTDVGTGWNQLIDLVVLIAIVVGEAAARTRRGWASLDGAAARVVAMTLGLTLLWVTLTGFVVTLFPDVRGTIDGELSYRKDPMSGLATSSTAVLSEDPYVPLSLGQTPVVLDPFMLPRLAQKEPLAIPELIRRIDAQEFDLVILVEPLEPLDRQWWTEEDLGIDVVLAISLTYTYAGRIQGYYLYEPRGSRSAA